MSETPLRRPSNLECASDALENGPAPFQYELPTTGYAQPTLFGFSANTEVTSGREDPPGPNPYDRPTPAKVAIPRTTRPVSWTTSRRVGQACENCRDQKTKCSGHRPSCHRCRDNGVWCCYGDRKRERTLKELEDLTAQVQTYEKFLRDLYPRLDALSAQQVDQTLSGQFFRGSSAPPFESVGTDHPLSTVSYTKEDFNRDGKVQAMGFVGEHSEIAWLCKLKHDLNSDSILIGGDNLDRPPISSLSYFQDDIEIPGLDDIDLFTRPLQHLADKLVDNYFQAVHPAFPIIGKGTFMGQYRTFYLNQNVRPGKRWIAVLNLVFAISAKHSTLAESQHDEDAGGHTAYFGRAWRLSIANVALLDHPNLQQVQVEGLTALYLLSTGQMNRSWRIVGIAIQSAVAMGLNLRNETHSITELSKEIRYRLWWTLFALDTMLCEIIGRPPSIGVTFCSTPLPIPYKEEDFGTERVRQIITDQGIRDALMTALLSRNDATPDTSDTSTKDTLKPPTIYQTTTAEFPTPNISLYFLYAVDWAFLTREVIQTLYAPGAAKRSWPEIEAAIVHFNNTADNWLARLPAEFHFTKQGILLTFARQRASLGFQFYTIKLLLSQPCLRRLAYPISSAGPFSVQCGVMAKMCVQMACEMLSLLPDKPSTSWLHKISPWWCVLHHIMQATTVLLIELFRRNQPKCPEATDLIPSLEKAMCWLRKISVNDPSSQQAWLVCMDIISQHGRNSGLEINVAL
ncbi:hypothetical protein N7540_003515 [Penicillium herquei]|nr:hypothetical protein N7540_003515 [Penicillium herquei]